MKLFFKFLFIFSLTLTSCMAKSNHLKEADKIINNFNNHLVSKKILPLASGGGFFDSIEAFNFEYGIFDDPQSIDYCRRLIVEETEIFIEMTNNPNALPYIKDYPFNEKRIELAFNFINKKSQFMSSDNLITRVFLFNGQIIYSKYIKDKFKSVYEETYAEAYQKVYGVPLPDRKKQFGINCE